MNTTEAFAIYDRIQLQLKTASEQFFKDTQRGTSRVGMEKWNAYIKDKLNIDNIELFGL